MGIENLSYEKCREKRVEENKKRLEDLNLIRLSQALKNLSPKTSPMKKGNKPRTAEKKMVPVRRSARVANKPAPAPVYAQISSASRLSSPRKNYEVREYAIEEAEKLFAKLVDEGFPTVLRPMLPSHVSGCFWLGLPSHFCQKCLPSNDGMVTLVDEEGDKYPVLYLAGKRGLSGGWRGFAEAHELVDGDAVIFQVVSPSVLKVYIIRGSGLETGSN